MKINQMFAVHETQKSLSDYIELSNGDDKRNMWLGAMLMWNHIAHVINNEESA